MDSSPILLGQLASMVGGRLIGDADLLCHGAAPLYEVSAGQVTLLDNPRRPEALADVQAVAVVVKEPLDAAVLPCGLNAQLVVDDPHAAFATIVARFQPAAVVPVASVHPTAGVDSTAELGRDCIIEANATIGRHVKIGDRCRVMAGVTVMDHTTIGDDCVLYPAVVLYDRTIIANRVTIHAGSVIGAYGFGYKARNGQHVRAPQLGYVRLEDDVELGAGVTIDRGTYGSTRIGAGTKVDNQVMIAHNCQIGRNNLICSQVGIAGSCRTGDNVILAGQVGLKDHITLGDGVIVGAQAGVMDDLSGGQVYLGSPATTQRDQMQIMAIQRRLPEMRRTIKTLERLADRLEKDGESGDGRCAA